MTYIYGTWATVTGLTSLPPDPRHRSVRKATRWLLSVQNPDGGWGESCRSDLDRRYTPLGFSTPSQTAWALDALIAAGEHENPAVLQEIECLADLIESTGVETSYPTGAGLPGGFSIHYHSYRYVWPLIAFSHFAMRHRPKPSQ